jgi:hypothetical protein
MKSGTHSAIALEKTLLIWRRMTMTMATSTKIG